MRNVEGSTLPIIDLIRIFYNEILKPNNVSLLMLNDKSSLNKIISSVF